MANQVTITVVNHVVLANIVILTWEIMIIKTAVIFRIKKVEEGLLCESEKIIIEFATTTATTIAEMKYASVFRSYICFFADRSNHFQIIILMYHFPHEYYT